MPVSKKGLLKNWRTCSKMKSNRWKTSSEIKQQHHKNLELLLKGHSWEFYWVTRYWELPQDSVGTCRWWCELSEMHINYMSHNQDIEAYKTTLIMLGVHTELPCHTLSHNQGRKACKTSLNSFEVTRNCLFSSYFTMKEGRSIFFGLEYIKLVYPILPKLSIKKWSQRCYCLHWYYPYLSCYFWQGGNFDM